MTDRDDRGSSRRESASEELLRKARESLAEQLESRGDQLPFDTSGISDDLLERFDDAADRLSPVVGELESTARQRIEAAPAPIRERVAERIPRRPRRRSRETTAPSPIEDDDSKRRRRIRPGVIIFAVFIAVSILRQFFD